MLRATMFGFLNIRKPAGPTSHDVVASVRRRLGRGVKVGHAGTLDPFAEGVLVVCVGAATRLADYVQAATKQYRAVIELGATSSTDDVEGEITYTPPAAAPGEEHVREVLRRFVGTIEQVPPAHSAVHVAGRRAYKLARAGLEVNLPARPVAIHRLDLLSYAYPRLEIGVACGSGTYIRALARDIGRTLATGGYCRELTRTVVGDFRLDQAVTLDELDPQRHLLPPALAVAHLPHVTADADQVRDLKDGKRIALPAPVGPGELAIVDAAGRLLAIARPVEGGSLAQPIKVFAGVL